MKIICITLGFERCAQAQTHFSERGVDAQFFYGFDAVKLGVDTTCVYERDSPGSGYKMGQKPTGIWLSHRSLWAALLLLPDDLFLILEDDASFPVDWRGRVGSAIVDAGDFDVLFVGSCCTGDKPRTHIAGAVYEVRWPICLQGYVVRRSALETMIKTQDDARCYAPMDISLVLHTFEQLKVRTVLPRILDQFNTIILD